MADVIRRWAHQGGNSWRKWGDSLVYDKYGWLVRPLLFWALCIDLGALVALWVR